MRCRQCILQIHREENVSDTEVLEHAGIDSLFSIPNFFIFFFPLTLVYVFLITFRQSCPLQIIMFITTDTIAQLRRLTIPNC